MIQALPPAIVAGELVRLQTRQHVVALTFDGGGNADAAKRVLAILKRDRVPGTFFLTGHFVQTYPLLSRAIGRRYPVANHTVDHLDMRRLSTPAATREVTQAETMIRRATGRDPRPLFRFPYGARDARTLGIVHSARLYVGALDGGHVGLDGPHFADRRRCRAPRSRSPRAGRDRPHAPRSGPRSQHDRLSRSSSSDSTRAARGYRFVTLRGIRAP